MELTKNKFVLDWIAQGIAVLALAQVFPWFNFGYIAAGALALGEAFPAAAMAGVALDLAGISAVPMTAAVCLACFGRMFPFEGRWTKLTVPAAGYLAVSAVCGV